MAFIPGTGWGKNTGGWSTVPEPQPRPGADMFSRAGMGEHPARVEFGPPTMQQRMDRATIPGVAGQPPRPPTQGRARPPGSANRQLWQSLDVARRQAIVAALQRASVPTGILERWIAGEPNPVIQQIIAGGTHAAP